MIQDYMVLLEWSNETQLSKSFLDQDRKNNR